MAVEFGTPVNFNLYELLQATAQNLAAAPPHKPGRFYFDTVQNKLGVSNGTTWAYMGESGAIATDTEAVQDIVAALFAGSTSVTISYNDAAGTATLSVASGAISNAQVNASAAITLDKLAETTGLKILTAAERTKLSGVATGATANSTDATLLARANHTGTQSADTVVDGTTNKAYTATEKTKLSGIATGATANSADATLLARANHTGTQTASTISDFQTAVDARVNNIVGAAPAALDTLVELANALGNDANFAATITAQLALKANISSLAAVATAGTYASLTGKPLYTTTIGDGTATVFTVTHNLNTRAVIVDVSYAATPFSQIITQVDKTTVNTVTITFGVAPTAGQYLVTVQG